MKERTTQLLLALLVGLIGAQLIHSVPQATAQEDEANRVPEVLRARAIELVDDRGQVRGQLKVEPDGAAVFRLRDAKGTIRVKLDAEENGSGLLLLDGQTEPAVHILAKNQGTTLTLAEKGKSNRVFKP